MTENINHPVVLETKKLGKTYHTGGNYYRALKGIDLKVYKGEFLGIMGPSGSGKSTLLNLISTVDRPTEGKVHIEGSDVFALKENELSRFRREKLGFIFQDYNLLNQMNVYENITLPMTLVKMSKSEQKKRVDALAQLFGLEKILDKKPANLSGGEKQRVTAARAIIMNPVVVMADEPTGALDSRSSQKLMEVLKRMNEEQGVTIVMVTHDDFAASYCSRIVRIKDGHVEKSE